MLNVCVCCRKELDDHAGFIQVTVKLFNTIAERKIEEIRVLHAENGQHGISEE